MTQAQLTGDILQALAGEWQGEEAIAATRWGPGGSAQGWISSRLDLDGRVLVQDYREERDGKPALQVHAVFVAGPGEGQYGLYWFDSYGFVPTEAAPGHWDGAALTFVRSSPRGRTRHRYEPLDADTLHVSLASSFDDGASWEPVLSATYRRVTAD
jgi:hypothetical protein